GERPAAPGLKARGGGGAVVVGMPPPGTPAEEVERVIRDQRLGYPTFLAAGRADDTGQPVIGGYPAGVFPYCILVDAQGRVAGHGPLADVLDKFGTGALLAPRKHGAKKP